MAVFIFGRSDSPFLFNETFSEASWADIIKACQMDAIPDTWDIADQKAMTIDGVEYQIAIIGKHHDEYSDGTGKAPITFQLRDCYGTDAQMNAAGTNAGGWGASEMRNIHLPAILSAMPTDVKAAIREVNKLTAVNSVITTTADKLFLLSQVEVVNSTAYSTPGEGTQYKFYANGRSAVKTKNGYEMNWYNRSPLKDSSSSFCLIGANGSATAGNSAYSRSISFAFCF